MRLRSLSALLVPCLFAVATAVSAEPGAVHFVDPQIQQARGVDATLDYASLYRFGPWDDRNYQLTAEDLELLAP
ncbi:MAG: hypothetical protein AAGE94_10820, partial [Acidobacteriota bacterium]